MFANTQFSVDPIADQRNIIQRGKARFSILKSRLIRMEYDPEEKFEDGASQIFWYRNQPYVNFNVSEQGGFLTIETDDLILKYKLGEEFHYRHLEITSKYANFYWRYGDPDYTNLGGTYRTLDRANGEVDLEKGLLSRAGWSLVDDSETLVFDETVWLHPRNCHSLYKDLYFLGYGHDYLSAIKEYQDISGKPGLVPRWALGNWWSRYWAYSQEDLTNLMSEFQANDIPLSVCIVDMDWHITRTGNSSSGWTGYTWNKNLFPDPEKFISFLHNNNLKTALNLHPAEGVHPHEDQYEDMAKRMDIDPATKEPIPFDIASKEFAKAYFEILHHPFEKQGVDFWWIDWQQGSKTKTKGLDPLYALNHLHYYDLGRNQEKRPFIFSRWPGLGGHRYPIGFSGDTIVSWDSLAFQPEFTSTASNVAYGWWSHDIGGHCDGIEDPELFLRWVQYGVFSPVLRIHSTNNPFIDRRPWAHGADTLEIIRVAMQLRHQLVPLLYSANWKNATTGEPMVLPLYYSWPDQAESYLCPQEYVFCQQLIAAPFTSPIDTDTGLSRQVVWLPDGNWYNFFTGEFFQGGHWHVIYGTKSEIPVFAKGGAIIPMDNSESKNGVDLPQNILLRIFAGSDSEFTLYEDDGVSQEYLQGQYALTKITQIQNGSDLTISIKKNEGVFSGIPQKRSWTIEIFGISKPENLSVSSIDKVDYVYHPDRSALTINIPDHPINAQIELTLYGVRFTQKTQNREEKLSKIVSHAKMPTALKLQFTQKLKGFLNDPTTILDIAHLFKPSQLLAIFETFIGPKEEPYVSDAETAYNQMKITMHKWVLEKEESA